MTPYAALPDRHRAGDTLLVEQSLSVWPAPTWTLYWRLINAAGVIDLEAGQDGESHRLEVAAAVTAGWTAGRYNWTQYVSDGTARQTLASGSIEVLPDLAAMTSGFDARTPARKALDDARAAYATWISTDGHVTDYQIGDRTMRFAGKADLLARIQWLEREVAREERAERLAQGLGGGRRLLVRY